MATFFSRYAPALVPLVVAGGVAAALAQVADPLTAWASAALVASVLFLILLLRRPKRRRAFRAPLSMADLVRADETLADPPLSEAPLLAPETDAALRETLDALRQLARAHA